MERPVAHLATTAHFFHLKCKTYPNLQLKFAVYIKFSMFQHFWGFNYLICINIESSYSTPLGEYGSLAACRRDGMDRKVETKSVLMLVGVKGDTRVSLSG